MTNQDMIKVMMGKYDELSHLPKMAKDTLNKILAHSKVNKSVAKFADLLSVEVIEKLTDEKDKANIHEGFEPKMVI
jgi:hypothetical protein